MKIININILDTWFLSQEDVPNELYAFKVCVSEIMRSEGCGSAAAAQIVVDSLTHMKVDLSGIEKQIGVTS